MTSYYYAVKTLLENNVNKLPLNAKDIEAIIKNDGWEVIYYDLKEQKSVKVLEQFNVVDDAKKTRRLFH